jgi:hypothetical protein
MCSWLKKKLEPAGFLGWAGTREIKNEIGHVIISRSEILYGSRKYILLRGQKDENKPSKPKNGNWVPKSVWSCDISIDEEFIIDEENICF